jgi:hypothetical protein
MFEFMFMANNHEERKVANDKICDAEIDTCAISDSDQPYETGIRHPKYNDYSWIIVEMYNTKEEAIDGHKKWCNKFRDGLLPNELKDVGTSSIAKLCNAIVGDLTKPNKLQIKTEVTNAKN